MDSLHEDLSDDELDHLADLLLDRVDEDLVAEGDDEGILDLSELDGFLTAIVLAPDLIPPSRWLPVVWGDHPPAFVDEADAMATLQLLMRHMNTISRLLLDTPARFAPLMPDRLVDGVAAPIVADWCEGFMMGVELDRDRWAQLDEEARSALQMIALWTTFTDFGLEQIPAQEQPDDHLAVIHGCISILIASRQGASARPERHAPRRSPPKIGRNAPCPCGSGRKYKHCCLRGAGSGGDPGR